MKKTEQIERRRAPRTNLDHAMIDVCPKKVVSENLLRGKICDISTVGVKFTSFKSYKQDSKVYIRLLLIAVELKEDSIQQSLIEDFMKLMKKRDKHISYGTKE